MFYYQTEDGIRDLTLTGVQTCALFFSSRRRHTRSDRDWSSDVCSSDPRLNSSHDQISYAVFCLKQKIRRGSEKETSVLQSRSDLVCRLLLEQQGRADGVPLAGVHGITSLVSNYDAG